VDVSYLVFGINKLGAAFPAALAAVLLCILVYLLGRKLDRNWTGFFAAIMLATTPYFMKHSRTCRPDSLFVCFLALAILAYILAERNGRWWFVVGASLGLAVLTKQIAALIGVGVIGVDMIFSRRLGEFKKGRAWSGVALFLVVALPWHIAMLVQWGGSFLEGYFYPIRRIILSDYSPKSWFFYLKGITKFLPWALLLPVGIVIAVREFRRERAHRLIIIWMLVALAAFLLTRTKRLWYLFPALPPLAIITALGLQRLLSEKWRRVAASLAVVAFAATTVAAVAIPFKVDKEEWGDIRAAKPVLDRLAGDGPAYEFVERLPERESGQTTLAAVALFYTDHTIIPVTGNGLPQLVKENDRIVIVARNKRLDDLLGVFQDSAETSVEFSGKDYSVVLALRRLRE